MPTWVSSPVTRTGISATAVSAGFGNPAIPQGSVVSASLAGSITRTESGSGSRQYGVASASAGTYTNLGFVAANGTAPFDVDVTDRIAEIINAGDWDAGDPLNLWFRITLGSANNSRVNDAVLTIEWLDPVQEVDLEPLAAPVVFPPMGLSRRVSPAALAVPVTFPPLGVAAAGAVELAPEALAVPVAFPALAVTQGFRLAPVALAVPAAFPAIGMDPAGAVELAPEALAVPVAFPALAVEAAGGVEVAPVALASPVRFPALGIVGVWPVVPPPPWQEWIRSAEYRDLMSGLPTLDFRAEVVDRDEVVLAQVPMTDGSVTVDGEQPVRRRAVIDVPDPAFYPHAPTALLAKAAQNRVRVWQRVLRGPGRWGEVPMITGYTDVPELTHSATAATTFSVEIADAFSTIPEYSETVDVSGMRADLAIGRILSVVAPWVVTALTPVEHYLPAQYEAGVPGADPVADLVDIAAAAGCEVFADRMGVVVLRPVPRDVEPAADWSHSTVGELTVIPGRDYVNQVTVVSANPEVDPQIVSVWRDEDPSSPLNLLDPRARVWGIRLESGIVTEQGQADSYSSNEGHRRQQGLDVVKGVAIADWAREPGDVVHLDDPVTNRNGPHRIRMLSYPLRADAYMGFEVTGAMAW